MERCVGQGRGYRLGGSASDYSGLGGNVRRAEWTANVLCHICGQTESGRGCGAVISWHWGESATQFPQQFGCGLPFFTLTTEDFQPRCVPLQVCFFLSFLFFCFKFLTFS